MICSGGVFRPHQGEVVRKMRMNTDTSLTRQHFEKHIEKSELINNHKINKKDYVQSIIMVQGFGMRQVIYLDKEINALSLQRGRVFVDRLTAAIV